LVRSRKATKYRMTSIGIRCLAAFLMAESRAEFADGLALRVVSDTELSFECGGWWGSEDGRKDEPETHADEHDAEGEEEDAGLRPAAHGAVPADQCM
jgi:hypothetical protein